MKNGSEKNPMKIVYILNIFPKISETFILNEIVEMQKKGVEIEVFAYKDEKESAVHPDVRRIKVSYSFTTSRFRKITSHLYWFFKHPFKYVKTWLLILRQIDGLWPLFTRDIYNTVLIDRMRPDHLHAHFGDQSSNLAMLTHSLSGIPYTFTTHSYDIFEHRFKNWDIKSKLAKKHVTISLYNKKYIVEHLGVDEKDIEIIHCGIDLAKIPVNGAHPDNDLILCIARLHEEKGIDVLIEACRLLRDENIGFQCLIAGDGRARQSLQGLIDRYKLGKHIALLGNQTHDEVFGLLSRAKIKVLPSRSEGIPVSLMEAMAFRVPVVASNICGIPELIDDGKSGFLVAPDRPEIFAQKIKILLNDDSLRKTFSDNGYQMVTRQFNLKVETDKLLDLWQRPA